MTQTPNSPVRLNPASPHGAAEVQASRLRWLIRLRWLYVVGASALAAAVSFWQPHGLMTYLLAGAAAVLFAYNLLFSALVDRCGRRRGAEAAASLSRLTAWQIALDLAMLMAMMHITGGAYNLLLAVVVFHLAVAASLQSRAAARHEATFALALFMVLVVVEGVREPLPSLPGFLGAAPQVIDRNIGALIVSLACSFLIAGGCFWGTVHLTDAILERLRAINRRLSEANRKMAGLDLAKSRFLRVSSHQLRGPLAAVHTLISAAEEVGGFNAKQLDLMNRIRNRSDVMMTELDEMLTLSTIKENAGETVPNQAVDVGQAVRATVANFDQEAQQRGLTLSCACGGEAKVWAWEDALETVLEHLLSNAMHYTTFGGRVTVRTTPGQQSVQIEVADTGIGVPPEQQDRLFHEFFRATNARQVCGGTGLGLSIVQAVVERLGGRISIVSKPGEGTTVSLSLPLADPKDIVNDSEEGNRFLTPDIRPQKGTEANAPPNFA